MIDVHSTFFSPGHWPGSPASPASDVVGLRRTDISDRRRLSPRPALDLRHIVAVPADVLLVFYELVADRLLGIGSPRAEFRHAIDHVAHKVEAIEVVHHAH